MLEKKMNKNHIRGYVDQARFEAQTTLLYLPEWRRGESGCRISWLDSL